MGGRRGPETARRSRSTTTDAVVATKGGRLPFRGSQTLAPGSGDRRVDRVGRTSLNATATAAAAFVAAACRALGTINSNPIRVQVQALRKCNHGHGLLKARSRHRHMFSGFRVMVEAAGVARGGIGAAGRTARTCHLLSGWGFPSASSCYSSSSSSRLQQLLHVFVVHPERVPLRIGDVHSLGDVLRELHAARVVDRSWRVGGGK